ncbi:barstar family protein [Stenotrophomonas sp. C3(2023)]|uniref:barstar family protein n=1 Tax=Stenotrophomonas sp. C3(2023) TaxID=3080277 RepID=UPI00293C683F|nr:barstar family protein [Stenotrophomonas sp. C3(2023)]MDV3468314.1 barstar family protein [Stenotrophomonas sp. C3(2023)]
MNHDALGLGLHDINNAGVYAIGNGDVAPLAAAMRAAGLRVARVDLHGVVDKRTLLARLAAQLDFPVGFGGNWDALADNLRDLAWLPTGGGHALFLDDVDALRATAPAVFDALLDVLDDACHYWVEQDVPFWAFIAEAG